MLRSLKDLFDSLLAPTAGTGSSASGAQQLQLATAVLLVEVMRADTSMVAAERAAVLATLQREFGLAPDAQQRLLELAEQQAQAATDFHAFTSTLNARLDHDQKLRIVEAMWQVAYADGHLEAHEQHVLWRVADLLHLPHGAYINAKLRAKAASAGASGAAPASAAGGKGDGA